MELIDLWVSIEQVLTPEEFRIFKMTHRWKMSQEQIAEELGTAQKTVCMRYKKIIEKLRERV